MAVVSTRSSTETPVDPGLLYVAPTGTTAPSPQAPAMIQGLPARGSHLRIVDLDVQPVVVAIVTMVVLGTVLFSGLLPWLWVKFNGLAPGAAWSGALFLVGTMILLGLPNLPLAWWSQFRLEARFGFNKSTLGLWIADNIKSTLLGLAIGFGGVVLLNGDVLTCTGETLAAHHEITGLMRERIDECLDEINPRYRRVLELRLVQGVARDRAAAAMEVSIGTLDVLLFRACKAFRKVYVQRYGEGPQREFGQP